MRKVLLATLIINLGIALGAGLYESRIVVSNWLTETPEGLRHWDAAAAQRDNTGLRFWAFVSTGPLTLLTLANMIAAWSAVGTLRRWWLAAAGTALVERAFTFSYFIPTMIALMGSADSAESVATAARWENLNYVRHLLTGVALVAALQAFALTQARFR